VFAFQAAGLDAGGTVSLVSAEADAKTGTGADLAIDLLQLHGLTARRETVPMAAAEATAAAVMEIARRLDARLLVLGTVHRPRRHRFRRRSLVDALLAQSVVPLFWFA
jgi:nucleotide-binding universal stress UspA family protein